MNPEELGREVLDSIVSSMRDRFESSNVNRLLFYEDPRTFFDERIFFNAGQNAPAPPANGLNSRQIESIKLVKYFKKTQTNSIEDPCCICLDDFKDG